MNDIQKASILKEFVKSVAYQIINDELDRKMKMTIADIKQENQERRDYKAGYLTGLEQFSILINRIIATGDSANKKEV